MEITFLAFSVDKRKGKTKFNNAIFRTEDYSRNIGKSGNHAAT
jgi:hypothetical protein